MENKEIYLKQIEVCEHDVQFLCHLMNEETNLRILQEVPTTPNDWREAVLAWEDDSDEEDYLIYQGIAPVGWVGVNGLDAGNRTTYIKIVVLLPEYQGKGIGTIAVNQAVEKLKARGYSTFILYTDKQNVRAQNCYKKCGFAVTDTLIQEMSNGALAERLEMSLYM